MERKLKVNEIFTGVSGEVGMFPQGSWCTFIRLDGCNLRCKWCDTKRTRAGKHHTLLTPNEILDLLWKKGASHRVLITGGEPLCQELGFKQLIKMLREEGYQIQVETNGSIFPEYTYVWVDCWIVDYKLKSSGQTKKMMELSSLVLFPEGSYLKFVVSTKEDYEQAKDILKRMGRLPEGFRLKPVMSACPPMTHNELYQMMKKDSLLAVLFNVQIHKIAGLNEMNDAWDLTRKPKLDKASMPTKTSAIGLARWLTRRGAKEKEVRRAFVRFYKARGKRGKRYITRHIEKYMGLAAEKESRLLVEPKKGGSTEKSRRVKRRKKTRTRTKS